jgi:hypothetical protein
MRSPDPLEGVPDNGRYDTSQDRYGPSRDAARGDAGSYNHRGVTLEEEAYNEGWLPNARPTSAPDAPPLQGLFTIGMRGEPGWDDDPQFLNGDASVTHPPAK